MVKPTRVTNSIRALRFAAGEMTQSELADRVGATRQTIIAIEQGRYSPSLEMAFRIANVFGVPLNEVFHYPEESREDGIGKKQHTVLLLGGTGRTGRLVLVAAPGARREVRAIVRSAERLPEGVGSTRPDRGRGRPAVALGGVPAGLGAGV